MTPPLIAGVDISSRLIAIALLDAATGVLRETLELRIGGNKGSDPTMPQSAAFRVAADTLGKAHTVYIENGMGPHVRSVALGNRALGALIHALADHVGIKIVLWSPTEWKSKAGLPGNADKGRIRMHAHKHHKRLWNNGASVSQDLCDALTIARAGWFEHTGASRLAENA